MTKEQCEEKQQEKKQTKKGKTRKINTSKKDRPKDDHLSIGKRGEQAAARYLEKSGYEILERNWRCPAGEADLIARDCHTLVFIEVKTRTNIEKGFPSEAVDAKKRARYEKIAMWYLRDYEFVDAPVRFDIISIMVVAPNRALLKHYAGAFGQENV